MIPCLSAQVVLFGVVALWYQIHAVKLEILG